MRGTIHCVTDKTNHRLLSSWLRVYSARAAFGNVFFYSFSNSNTVKLAHRYEERRIQT